MHLTSPCDGPRISFNGVYTNLVHIEPLDNHVIEGGFGPLFKNGHYLRK